MSSNEQDFEIALEVRNDPAKVLIANCESEKEFKQLKSNNPNVQAFLLKFKLDERDEYEVQRLHRNEVYTLLDVKYWFRECERTYKRVWEDICLNCGERLTEDSFLWILDNDKNRKLLLDSDETLVRERSLAVKGQEHKIVQSWVQRALAKEEQDFEELIKKAAMGDFNAMVDIAKIYEKQLDGDSGTRNASGFAQSQKKVREAWKLAATSGSVAASWRVGEMYRYRDCGVLREKNNKDEEMLRWFHVAAFHGYANAHLSLGQIYDHDGKGRRYKAPSVNRTKPDRGRRQGTDYDKAPFDDVLAYKWYTLAAAGDITEAVKAKEKLEKRMSKEQLTEAHKLIADFKPPK